MDSTEYSSLCRKLIDGEVSNVREALNRLAEAHRLLCSASLREAKTHARIFETWRVSFAVRHPAAGLTQNRGQTGVPETLAWLLALTEDWLSLRSTLEPHHAFANDRVFEYVFLRDAPELNATLQGAALPEDAWKQCVLPWVRSALGNPGQPGKRGGPSDSYRSLVALVDLLNAVMGVEGSEGPFALGRSAVLKQLEELEKAGSCRSNELFSHADTLEPADPMLLDVFTILAFWRAATGAGEERAGWTRRLAELERPDDHEVHLLKHWAATIPLFEVFTSDEFGFEFDGEPPSLRLPAYHPTTGCDIPISVIGAQEVGKSSFLFSLAEQDKAEIKTIERKPLGNLEKLKRIWERGGPSEEQEEKWLWKTNEELSTTAWSKGSNEMFTVFVRDLPGEKLEKLVLDCDSDAVVSFRNHLSTAVPAATVLVVSDSRFTFKQPGEAGGGGEQPLSELLAAYWNALPDGSSKRPLLIVRNYLDKRLEQLCPEDRDPQLDEELVRQTQRQAVEKGGWWVPRESRGKCRSHYENAALRRMLHEDLAGLDSFLRSAMPTDLPPLGFFYLCSSGKSELELFRSGCGAFWDGLGELLRSNSAEGRRAHVDAEIAWLQRMLHDLEPDPRSFDVHGRIQALSMLAASFARAGGHFEPAGSIMETDFNKDLAQVAKWEEDHTVEGLAGVSAILRETSAIVSAIKELRAYSLQVHEAVLAALGIPGSLTYAADNLRMHRLDSANPMVRDLLQQAHDCKNPGASIVHDSAYGVLTTRCPFKDQPLGEENSPAKDPLLSEEAIQQLFNVKESTPLHKRLEELLHGAGGERESPKEDKEAMATGPMRLLEWLTGFSYSVLPGAPPPKQVEHRSFPGIGECTSAPGVKPLDFSRFYFNRAQLYTPRVAAVKAGLGSSADKPGSIQEFERAGAQLAITALGMSQIGDSYIQGVRQLQSLLIGHYLHTLQRAHAPHGEGAEKVQQACRDYAELYRQTGFAERMVKAEARKRLNEAYHKIGREAGNLGSRAAVVCEEAESFCRFYDQVKRSHHKFEAFQEEKPGERVSFRNGTLFGLFPGTGFLSECYDEFRRAAAAAAADLVRVYFKHPGWMAFPNSGGAAAAVQTPNPFCQLENLVDQIRKHREVVFRAA